MYKLNKVKEETIKGYQSLLKHIPNSIQLKNLKDIQLNEIITLINKCSAERQKQNLYDFAKSKNASIGDMGMQLEFFLQELRGYSTTYKYVTGNYEAYDISYYFCTEYERPEDTVTTCTNRVQNNINSMLTYVQNGCSN